MSRIKLTCMIDDDEIFVYAMRKLIKMKALSEELIVFDSVEKGLSYLCENQSKPDAIPDVILLDINLPVSDGWDFIHEFQQVQAKLAKQPRIYMLSSSSDSVDQQRAESYPSIQNYFTKPLSQASFDHIFKA